MKIKHILAVVLTLGLTSCINVDPMFRGYVTAHRSMHEANKLFNQKLIVENPAISEMDKATLLRVLEAEELMISETEKTLGVK